MKPQIPEVKFLEFFFFFLAIGSLCRDREISVAIEPHEWFVATGPCRSERARDHGRWAPVVRMFARAGMRLCRDTARSIACACPIAWAHSPCTPRLCRVRGLGTLLRQGSMSRQRTRILCRDKESEMGSSPFLLILRTSNLLPYISSNTIVSIQFLLTA